MNVHHFGSKSADSAGQPWLGRHFSSPQEGAFDEDTGEIPPLYLQALRRLIDGEGTEAQVVHALAQCRLLVPILAFEEQDTPSVAAAEDGGSSNDPTPSCHSRPGASVGTVTITAPDGRAAMPVFTHVASLRQWRGDARPVPVAAARAALAAHQQGAGLLVVDPVSAARSAPAATVPFVVRRPALWALAAGRPWVPAYEDPLVCERMTRAVESAAAGCRLEGLIKGHRVDKLAPRTAAALLHQVTVVRGRGVSARGPGGGLLQGGGAGPEVAIHVSLDEGLDAPTLGRLKAGIETALAAETVIADRVDSLSLSIRSSSSP